MLAATNVDSRKIEISEEFKCTAGDLYLALIDEGVSFCVSFFWFTFIYLFIYLFIYGYLFACLFVNPIPIFISKLQKTMCN